MRSSILWILFVLFVLHASATVAQESTHGHEHKLFAVVIANNASIDAEVAPLRYADDDGARYWELFSSIDNAEVHLLTTLDSESQLLFEGLARQTRPPSQSEVLKTLREVSESIARERARGVRTTLFVVFTGHGAVDDKGTGYLSLLDGPFTRQDLYRNIISPQIADRTHLIIDACNAYFMVRSRDGGGGGDDRSGETYDDEFMQFIQRSDQLSKTPTVGVFVSTAGAAEVHEWSRYRGGVFSHQLRSGLLGAADINGDLKISYQELKAYLAAANASVTNPQARINVFAKAPAQSSQEPLLELDQLRQTTLLELETERSGRYYLEDSRGVRYADFHKANDGTMRIALLWGPVWRAPHYFIRTETAEARIAVPDDSSEQRMDVDALSFVELTASARGSVEDAYRSGLFATPFGTGFFHGYNAATSSLTEPRAVPLDNPNQLQLGFGLGLGLSQPPLGGLSGQHTNIDASFDAWLSPNLALQLVGQYGTGSHDGTNTTFQLHRLMLGVGITGRLHLPASFVLEAHGRTGHQWLIASSPEDIRGDALSLRAELGGTVGYMLSDAFRIGLRASESLNVYTEDDREKQSAVFSLGLVLGFQR